MFLFLFSEVLTLHLLIAAAGSGTRMGASCNKLLLEVSGRSIINWTFNAVQAAKSITWIGIVGRPCDKGLIMPMVSGSSKKVEWINGGSSRQESVQLGLSALPRDAEYVLIHDGARCLVTPELIDKCSSMVLKGTAVVAATPVTDTIKKVDKKNFVIETPDRSFLWAAQTPQGFSVKDLKEGHKQANSNKWTVTDDASLFEKLGWPVRILESVPSNIKVTTKCDLVIAQSLLSIRKEV